MIELTFLRIIPVKVLILISNTNGEGISLARLKRISKIDKGALSRLIKRFYDLGLISIGDYKGAYVIKATQKGEAVAIYLLNLYNFNLIDQRLSSASSVRKF